MYESHAARKMSQESVRQTQEQILCSPYGSQPTHNTLQDAQPRDEGQVTTSSLVAHKTSQLAPPQGQMITSSSHTTALPNEIDYAGIRHIAFRDLELDSKNVIGQGAFGTVYKGMLAGTPVAIKAIAWTRFRKHIEKVIQSEIAVSASIRHPNVVQLMAYTENERCVYLVHEFVDGFNLDQLIFERNCKEQLPLTSAAKKYVALQCLQALAYLHSLGQPIIHRDIKPANILIAKGSLTTKLCDLGVSKIKSIQSMGLTTANPNNACGSPAYMSPECLLNGARATTESDIWSIGVTFVELFTENDAWELDNTDEDHIDYIKNKMKMKEVPQAAYVFDSEHILRRCLNYDRSQRPPAISVVQDAYFHE